MPKRKNGWKGLSAKVQSSLEKQIRYVRNTFAEVMITGVVVDYAPLYSGNVLTNTLVSMAPDYSKRFPHVEVPEFYASNSDRISLAYDLVTDIEKMPTFSKAYIQNNTEYNKEYMSYTDNPYFALSYNDALEWLRITKGGTVK